MAQQGPQAYFVHPQGNDTNKGSSADPWRTINAAVSKMKGGDTCILRAGVYRESVVISRNDIVIKAYPGDRVVVTGLDVVSDWTKHANGIYVASFRPQDYDPTPSPRHLGSKGAFLTQVFFRGKEMKMASYPDLPTHMLDWKTYGAAVTIFTDGTAIFGDAAKWSSGQWQGATFHAIVEKKFAAVQGQIHGNTDRILKCNQRTLAWQGSTANNFKRFLFSEDNGVVSGIGRGFITNSLRALDNVNEWYWDKEKQQLYIYPPDGQPPDMQDVEAQSRLNAFVLNGCNRVTIDGIHVMAGGVQITNSSRCVFTNCSIEYPVPYFIRGNEFDGATTVNIQEGNNNAFINCDVRHSWGGGIALSKGNGNMVENCLIEDVNWMGSYAGNIHAGGRGTIIRGNTLRSSGRFLVYGVGIKAGIITKNHMYNCMLIGQDGGAFYTNGAEGENTEISYNWIHDVVGVPWERAPDPDHNLTIGIYLDGGCKDFNIHHNVLWQMKYAVMLNPFTGEPPKSVERNRINNNTCWVSGPAAIVTQNSKYYANNEMSHNLVNKKVGALGRKQGNVIDHTGQLQSLLFSDGQYFMASDQETKANGAQRVNKPRQPRSWKGTPIDTLKAGANAGQDFFIPGKKND